jgi:hypothetical protein
LWGSIRENCRRGIELAANARLLGSEHLDSEPFDKLRANGSKIKRANVSSFAERKALLSFLLRSC